MTDNAGGANNNLMQKPNISEEQQRAFFAAFYEGYTLAARQKAEHRLIYRLAGTVVCLSFAGDALIPHLAPALRHLRTEEDLRPDLVIHIWDSESTGVKAPAPPCEWTHFTNRGDLWGFESKRIKTAFHYSEYSVNLIDLHDRIGVYWVKTPRHFPYWVYSSPFRSLFHWWLREKGAQLVHAAAVGTDEGAVLITGKGGAGKSSTALRCLDAGFLYLGDDYVVVRKDPVPTVHSLYCTAKLSPSDMERFPSFKDFEKTAFQENPDKETLFLYPRLKHLVRADMPLVAVLTPEITGETHPSLEPASFWHLHRSMSFTTMSQLPGADHWTHEYLGALLEKLPCFTLRLGNSRTQVPLVVKECLQDKASMPPATETPGEASEKPLISIIIPVYNGEKFIRQAIDSVVAQNYPATEIIVVDDGSIDNTRKIIESMKVDIRYFYQPNQGPAAARNRGIQNATADLIAFLDVDDYWPDNNLKMLMNEMQQTPDIDVVRGYAQRVREHGSGRLEYLGSPKESFPDYIGAGLYRRPVFQTVGFFDPFLIFGEDVDWYNRAAENNVPIKRLEFVTLYVRRDHGGNMTEGKSKVELNVLKTFKKKLDRARATGNIRQEQ